MKKRKKEIHASKWKMETPGEERQLLLGNTAGYATSILDERGYIYKWSRYAQRLTGYTAKEIVGKHYSTFYSKEDRQKRLPHKILERAARRGFCQTEGLRMRKDGSYYWASGIMLAIRDKKRKLRGYARFTQDATKKRELARQKDEFLGIAAHELKTPITTLNLYAQLLRERLMLSRDKQNLSMLRDIEEQSTRLVKLVNDLLTFNAIDAGVFTLHEGEFDMCALASKIAKRMRISGSTHTIAVRCALRRNVRGDADRIEEVLVNLLGNAIKYSPRARKITARISEHNGKALIAVHDKGTGIPPKERGAIFKRYYRGVSNSVGAVAGFGLGLYIASEIIKKHRQKIWVKSGKNGSTFYFTLTLAN